jgi:hypothetical protein
MSKNRFIHSLDSFSKSEKMDEADLTDMLSGFLGVAGDAVKREAKQKITAFLLEKLGIQEKSKFSRVVQEVVEEIPISDYPEIISGETNVEYWAPKFAKSIQGFLMSEGLNGMAESWGIDSSGFLYGSIKEALEEYFTNPNFQNKFAETIISIMGPSLGAGKNLSNKSLSSVGSGMKDDILKYSQAAEDGKKPSRKEADSYLKDFFSSALS